MKFSIKIAISCILISALSCKRNKLHEVVEVPLPSTESKVTIGQPDDVKANDGAFELYKLPYKFNDLAPNIDAMTMDIHYSKYYLAYTNNLNRILKETDKEDLPIEDILKKLDMSNDQLRNNVGGYYNHTFFWEILGPKSGGKPKDTLASTINRDFGSFANFKKQFSDSAIKQFGSGWTWLVVDKAGKLQITNTPNQDNPLMPRQTISGKPLLALDVWEHAYFLGYQQKRRDYVAAFFNIVNWRKVEDKYKETFN
jgi:Fe-Mn family superoxide dismutase